MSTRNRTGGCASELIWRTPQRILSNIKEKGSSFSSSDSSEQVSRVNSRVKENDFHQWSKASSAELERADEDNAGKKELFSHKNSASGITEQVIIICCVDMHMRD